jgi:prepilin-type N-terminal cleavage/methylation domain-containing protein
MAKSISLTNRLGKKENFFRISSFYSSKTFIYVFTLIELLVVIAVIAIFASLS